MDQPRPKFDIVLVADMSRGGNVGLKIRREVEALSRAGYACALRHVPMTAGGRIAPDVQLCVRNGLAQTLTGADQVSADLVIVHSPGYHTDPVSDLSNITAAHTVLVVDRPPNPAQMGAWFSFALGRMVWAPTSRWVRERLESMALPIPLTEADWRPIGAACEPRPDHAPMRFKPVVGRVGVNSRMQWPKEEDDVKALHPENGRFDVWMLGRPSSELVAECPSREDWTIVPTDTMTVERFVGSTDAVMAFTNGKSADLPDAVIASAMMTGKPVVMSPHLRPHFGPAAIYADPADAEETLATLLDDPAEADDLRTQARLYAKLLFSEDAFLEQVRSIIGAPDRTRNAPAAAKGAGHRPRALFVPSNGIGIGHATRLLAIARRLDDLVEPVFASLGQASSIIERFGYTAEYLPSYTDIGAEVGSWDGWFRHQLGELIDRYAPDVVVYDGNHPTDGLVHAALSDGRCRLVWVRRGMVAPKPSPFLRNTRFFDAIIEPGELASERDTSPTARLRHEVREVPPIRLLDSDDLLGRAEARDELRLDPERPAVLVQLGSGGNRDVVDLADRFVSHLRRFDGLQIVIAEWSNGAIALPRWAGTRVMRGFPISRYFNAFDFSVSAAGYNTYHEVLAFGLPTIFVANRHPSMDDQGARAEFAQDNGAGFDLTQEEMHLFPTLCKALLSPAANAAVRANCAKLDPSNGATEAAAIIKRLAGVA